MDGDPSEAFEAFGELFGDLFGRGPAKPDLSQTLHVTLAETDRGGVRAVEAPRQAPCARCEGRGGPPGVEPVPCGECDGRGQKTETTGEGIFRITTNCKRCRGVGRSFETPCEACDGHGTEARPGRWDVTLPPGIAHGQKLRLKGQGNDLGDGPGDAYFGIVVEPHPTLRRHGDDLHAKVRIDPAVAASGGPLAVPWLEGDATLTVPAGTSHGTRLTRKGWGMTRLGQAWVAPPEASSPYRTGDASTRGDLIVTVQTREDEALDPHEVLGVAPGATRAEIQAAYRRFAQAHHPDRHPDDPDAAERFEQASAAYAELVASAPEHAPVEASSPGARFVIGIAVALVALAIAILLLR
ncbi:MAG: DnaJ C-terminal domain-containing protein [Sandaracinaceae bacterium]